MVCTGQSAIAGQIMTVRPNTERWHYRTLQAGLLHAGQHRDAAGRWQRHHMGRRGPRRHQLARAPRIDLECWLLGLRFLTRLLPVW